MAATRVLVDANVLWPVGMRAWLFMLRNETGGGMFTIATTEDVIAEALYNIRRRKPDIAGRVITDVRSKIVGNVDEIVDDFKIDDSYPGKDPDDAHVHAAAVAAQVDVLLTCDTGWLELDEESLAKLPYEPQTPDYFFTLVDDSAPEAVRAVIRQQLDYHLARRPDVDLPGALRRAQCPEFAKRVGDHLQTLPVPSPAELVADSSGLRP